MDCESKKLMKFICQKEATEQDACTQYTSSVTGEGGHCVHTDQCPGYFFVNGLCDDYNDKSIQCCLNTGRCKSNNDYFIKFKIN
jgi:hypothetical protein